MLKYSVIIPFHSNANILSVCVDSLIGSMDLSESEIIIVDNNADGSQMPHELHLDKYCKIIYSKENLMYPKAINIGSEKASGEYLIFCDADTCVTKGFQIGLLDALKNPNVGYASSMLLNMKTGNVIDFGITSSYYNFPHPFAGRPKNFNLVNETHYPLAACAACSAIKRDLFWDMGGFDSELVHSYSDIDLCLRLIKSDFKTACVANSIVYHCGSSTNGSGMSASLKEDTKGIFCAKHPNVPVKIKTYLDKASAYFASMVNIKSIDYFVIDCSTIANPEIYIDTIVNNLNIKETMRYRHPYSQRDAHFIDLLNFVPHSIRNYKVPILYFVDNFLSLKDNILWKICRSDYDDIVVDRNANIELLRNI